MNSDSVYDVLVIGGGQAGIPLARDLAKQGNRVALAERKHLGGSCINFGCTPTKAVIASAKAAQLARRAYEFGLRIPDVQIIGLEMAQFYRRMGSWVTVIQEAGQVAEQEDEDVSEALQHFLEAEDIAFRLNARVTRVHRRKGGVTLTIRGRRGTSRHAASHLFVATGRRPNTDDLGLTTIGLRTTKKGFIKTNRRLATAVRGVWAAGDIRGGPMFTHTSWDDYRVLLSQLGGDRSRTVDRVTPYAIYTDPQLGRVGLTASQAQRLKRTIKVGRFEMRKNGKAKELGEPGGLIKVIADTRTRRVLGAAVLAAEGAELIHLFITLMNARAPYTVIRDAVHIHPTLSEAVQNAVAALQ